MIRLAYALSLCILVVAGVTLASVGAWGADTAAIRAQIEQMTAQVSSIGQARHTQVHVRL